MHKSMSSNVNTISSWMNSKVRTVFECLWSRACWLVDTHHRTENDLIEDTERRIANAEQRALVSEEQMSKMQEELKVNTVLPFGSDQDSLFRAGKTVGSSSVSSGSSPTSSTVHQRTETVRQASHHSTIKCRRSLVGQRRENLKHLSKVHRKIDWNRWSAPSVDLDLHSFAFEPTEIDYLKEVVLAYMTGRDRPVSCFSDIVEQRTRVSIFLDHGESDLRRASIHGRAEIIDSRTRKATAVCKWWCQGDDCSLYCAFSDGSMARDDSTVTMISVSAQS